MSDTEKKPDRPVTVRYLIKVLETYTDGIVQTIKKAIDGPRVAVRFDALEARVSALENAHIDLAQKALKGGATWQRGVTYAVNDTVNYDGSLWKCVEGHVSGATFSHEHFLLQVKRGRDGRDMR